MRKLLPNFWRLRQARSRAWTSSNGSPSESSSNRSPLHRGHRSIPARVLEHSQPNHALKRTGEQSWCNIQWLRRTSGVASPPPLSASVIMLLVAAPALHLAGNEPTFDPSQGARCQVHLIPGMACEAVCLIVVLAAEPVRPFEAPARFPLVGASIFIPPRLSVSLQLVYHTFVAASCAAPIRRDQREPPRGDFHTIVRLPHMTADLGAWPERRL